MPASEATPAGKPYEVPLTLLIALSAALAGLAAYLSSAESDKADDANRDGLSALSDANTMHLQAAQDVAHDDQVLVQVMLLEDEGRMELAQELLNGTQLVARGFVNPDFSLPPQFATHDAAFEAYEDAMFADAEAVRAQGEDHFERGEDGSARALDMLLSTVFLSIAAVVATVALVASQPRVRGALAALVLVGLVGTATFIVVTVT